MLPIDMATNITTVGLTPIDLTGQTTRTTGVITLKITAGSDKFSFKLVGMDDAVGTNKTTLLGALNSFGSTKSLSFTQNDVNTQTGYLSFIVDFMYPFIGIEVTEVSTGFSLSVQYAFSKASAGGGGVSPEDPMQNFRLTALEHTRLKIDGTMAMTGDLNFGTKKAINLADPTVATDGATKAYVDSLSEVKAYKLVDTAIPLGWGRVANINATGETTILISGDESSDVDLVTIHLVGNCGVQYLEKAIFSSYGVAIGSAPNTANLIVDGVALVRGNVGTATEVWVNFPANVAVNSVHIKIKSNISNPQHVNTAEQFAILDIPTVAVTPPTFSYSTGTGRVRGYTCSETDPRLMKLDAVDFLCQGKYGGLDWNTLNKQGLYGVNNNGGTGAATGMTTEHNFVMVLNSNETVANDGSVEINQSTQLCFPRSVDGNIFGMRTGTGGTSFHGWKYFDHRWGQRITDAETKNTDQDAILAILTSQIEALTPHAVELGHTASVPIAAGTAIKVPLGTFATQYISGTRLTLDNDEVTANNTDNTAELPIVIEGMVALNNTSGGAATVLYDVFVDDVAITTNTAVSVANNSSSVFILKASYSIPAGETKVISLKRTSTSTIEGSQISVNFATRGGTGVVNQSVGCKR